MKETKQKKIVTEQSERILKDYKTKIEGLQANIDSYKRKEGLHKTQIDQISRLKSDIKEI